ncbi:thiol-disulfide oxidoreductase DCC family protein [Pseudoalteromonas sp. XMcav1-K]|uniref:thiol-disulfide oxidoreductase DCC family protein n=1 Tax=Pseudoalteromonas sp. XMcav1-K TaxID=3374372 RepID=UPI003756E47A
MKNTVYYDAQCPLCSKEIALWRKLSGERFEFKDVHSQNFPRQQRTNMLKLLHLRDEKGSWHIGLNANFKLWRSHPIGWVSYCFSIPGIYWLVNHFYNVWAERRYEKRYGCEQCQL